MAAQDIERHYFNLDLGDSSKINDKIEKGLSSHRPRREPQPSESLGAGSVPI